nr:S24 family peptidase [Pseudomonas sp. R2-37-08W]
MTRKRLLPPDRLAECRAAHELFLSKKKELGLSQRKIADAAGITPAAVNLYFKGINPLNAQFAAILSEQIQEPVDKFSTRLAAEIGKLTRATPERAAITSNAELLGPIDLWDDDTPLDDDEVYVPFLKEVELSAGQGRTAVEQSHKQKLRFGKITLRKQGVQPSDAVCVTVSGNSMEPVLPDGSTVGVDQGTTSITDGKMYAIDHGGQLRVKTLYRLPGGGIRMRSFNRDEHPDEEYSAIEMIENEIMVIGRVFWSSALW